MAFFFLTTGWQPDVLSAGEGEKKKKIDYKNKM